MTLSPNRWRPVGPFASDKEREALECVRELLPDDPLCWAWSNVSIPDDRREPTEIDLLLLNGNGLFVVELKGWHGSISGETYRWFRSGRQLHSPLVAADGKARRLKALLKDLRSEQGDRVRLPRVRAIVLLHGRQSKIALDDRARDGIYGLDGFQVKGVPLFSQFLNEPPTEGYRLDRQAVNALAKLLRVVGMEPWQHSDPEPEPVALPEPSPTPEGPEGREGPEADGPLDELLDEQPQALPLPLLRTFTEESLIDLGVPHEALAVMRDVLDETDLIGLLPDAVVDDLTEVLAGRPLEEVVGRRAAAREILDSVDAQAAALPVAPALPEPQVSPALSTPIAEHEPPIPEQPVRRAPLPTRQPQDAVGRSRISAVAPERLLDVARAEVVQGRLPAARALLRAVEDRVDGEGATDWSVPDLLNLTADLNVHTLLVQRIETLIAGLEDDVPPAPALASSPAPATVGKLWSEAAFGPSYSLLLRVADVLDRTAGVYLSDVIGEERAAVVNGRLLRGRPDGGRVRITPSGTVISRRDSDSPWFVVGSVAADEWFPADAAMMSRSQSFAV
jgi:hypothetical protein